MKNIPVFMLLALFCVFGPTCAQEVKSVHGSYTYTVGDNDDITLREAKRKCVELAKAEAIKAEFGEMVTSDVIDSNVETNGESVLSYFWENTVAMAKGDWLGDTQEPAIGVEYADGKLVFSAEVWGTAREIVQSKTELKWTVLKGSSDYKAETDVFNSGEQVYVSFLSPADGYVAIYLITDDNETACLLPYRNNSSGQTRIKGGQQYQFFDKAEDALAPTYRLRTKHAREDNQLVVIYSPNAFTKCVDSGGDPRHPNSLSTRDFQKWLLRCQRLDRDMVVSKKWLVILNSETE